MITAILSALQLDYLSLCLGVVSPNQGTLEATYSELGVTSVHLACAGANADNVSELIEAGLANSSLITQAAALSAELQGHADTLALLADQIMTDAANDSLRLQYEAANASYAACASQLAQSHSALFEVVSGSLPGGVQLLLQVQISNQDHLVPPEFKVLTLSSASWTALECAVRAEEWSNGTGEPLDPIHQATLASAREEPGVILALANLQANHAGIASTFAAIEVP